MEIKDAPKLFSTFEAAKICGVVHTTVINWVNRGMLKAHTTPGGHRRIALADLVDFMKRFEMPIPADLLGRAKKVLIVEDDVAVQRMLRRTLASLPGVELNACSGGLEALVAIGKDAPDLVVLDIRIPQVNGVEVCKLLRSSDFTRPIKIIAITGEPLQPEAEDYLRAEVDGFFQKPLPTDALRDLAQQLLDLDVSVAAPR